METYRNMNASNGRNCNNPVNQGYRRRDMMNYGRQNQVLNDNNGRSMEMNCVCTVSERDCHKIDKMEGLGRQFPLVMAYVPWQQWGDLYEADQALKEGTIFKDLNKIFCGVRC